MEFLEFSVAILLGSFGAALLFFLLFCLFRPFLSSFLNSKNTLKLKKVMGRLERADELIEEGQWESALNELRRAVLFDYLGSHVLIDATKEHHQNILSRCLIVSEELGGRLENIAEVERLFLERAELHHLLMKTRDAFQKLEAKRSQAGKKTADWTKGDFDRRVQEIRSAIEQNEVSLELSLEQLFSSASTSDKENITIH